MRVLIFFLFNNKEKCKSYEDIFKVLYISEYPQGHIVLENEVIWIVSSSHYSQQIFMNDPQRVGH